MDPEGDEEMHSDQEYAPSESSDHHAVGSDEENDGHQSPVSIGPTSPSSPTSPQGSSSPVPPQSNGSAEQANSPPSPVSQDESSPDSPQGTATPDSPAPSPDPNTPSSLVSQDGPASPQGPNSPASPDRAVSGDEDGPSSPHSKNEDKVLRSPGDSAVEPSDDDDDQRSVGGSDGKSDSEVEEVVREDAQSDRGSDNENGKHSSLESDEEGVKSPAGRNSPHSGKGSPPGDYDQASVHSEIEERASINSDKEDENFAPEKGTESNHEGSDTESPSKKEISKSGSGHDSDSDSVIGVRKSKMKTKGSNRGVKSDSESNSDEEEEDEEDKARVGELIADIFGESDDDEEFEGFGEDEVAATSKKADSQRSKIKAISDSEDEEGYRDENKEKVEDKEVRQEEEEEEEEEVILTKKKKKQQKVSKGSDHSDDDDEGVERENMMISDFDLMIQKKKEESGHRRKRKGYDIINDSDDLIADIINQMKVCADEDRVLNKNRQAATKKLKLLPVVVSQLKKLDLKVAFLDQGVLNIMTEWLAPLPDRSLPHLHIRENLLRLLAEFPPIDQSALKASGIGRAVMYLYKHPRETKENRERAGKLISEWSRPIFNLNTNYHSISKEEREKRDFEHMPKKRKFRLESGDDNPKDIDRAFTGDEKSLRPGDKGWIGRARVPLPSTKDYVVRPKWNTETDMSKSAGRKQLSRLDKHVRSFNEKKKAGKMQRAVTISIEGRKMAL